MQYPKQKNIQCRRTSSYRWIMSFQSQKNDIKKRLRYVSEKNTAIPPGLRDLLWEAAEKIESLEQESLHWSESYTRRTNEFVEYVKRQTNTSTNHDVPTSPNQPSNLALAHALDRFLTKAMNRRLTEQP